MTASSLTPGGVSSSHEALARIERAVQARRTLLERDPSRVQGLRLFNGFTEGVAAISLELYARTLVLHDYASAGGPDEGDRALCLAALEIVRGQAPFVNAALRKVRRAKSPALRAGELLLGGREQLATELHEDGVRYALELALNRDTSFYLDTRALRRWVRATVAQKSVLNTFAYTGSLGVAACAAPARRVVQTDRTEGFLRVAERSYALNGFAMRPGSFYLGDYFKVAARLRAEGALFDCVLVDPPFFSQSSSGRVDLEASVGALLNKVRPLIAHEGYLVAVNNAVFVSGDEYDAALAALCRDGYLALESRVDVDEDARGLCLEGAAAKSPAPYAHSTKIAVLRATRRDRRGATR